MRERGGEGGGTPRQSDPGREGSRQAAESTPRLAAARRTWQRAGATGTAR